MRCVALSTLCKRGDYLLPAEEIKQIFVGFNMNDAAVHLRPKRDAIEQFLNVVGETPFNIVSIVPDGIVVGRNFDTVTDAAAFAVQQNELLRDGVGRNVYWSPATLWRKPTRGKAVKQDVAHTRWLWCDIDPADGESRAAAQARLTLLTGPGLPADVPPPTIVVSSGYGVQLYWRLKEPWVLPRCTLTVGTDDKDSWSAPPEWEAAKLAVEERNNWLVGKFGADEAGKNLDRILRLPGTVNWPNKKKRQAGREPSMAEVLSWN